jgi:hypothetical protein
MNSKTVLVAALSSVFAAGLTYWVVAPVRRGLVAAPRAALTPPAGPPLVISTAGPESLRIPDPAVAPALKPLTAKPSPTGDPIVARPAPTTGPEPEPLVTSKPTEVASTPPPAPTESVTPPSPAPSPAPAPPERVTLSPPKESDRAQPAVLRDRPSAVPNTVTIAPGTTLMVRIGETLSVQHNLTGDTFFATLDQPLVAGGYVIAERGARVEGKIVEVDKASRMSGTSRMSLALTQVNSSDGQRIPLQTSTYTKDGAERNHKNDAAKIGGGAVLGAVIGAAAGGGKGAAVGAGVGGAAGTGAVLLSGGKNVTIPVETRLSLRIEQPVTITERVVQ